MRPARSDGGSFRQGDPGDSLFLVASGRLFIESSDGEQLTIRHAWWIRRSGWPWGSVGEMTGPQDTA